MTPPDDVAARWDRTIEAMIGRPLTDEVRAELAAMDEADPDTWPAWWRDRLQASADILAGNPRAAFIDPTIRQDHNDAGPPIAPPVDREDARARRVRHIVIAYNQTDFNTWRRTRGSTVPDRQLIPVLTNDENGAYRLRGYTLTDDDLVIRYGRWAQGAHLDDAEAELSFATRSRSSA